MESPTPIRPVLSHMGIYVHDMDAMEDFYTRVMGLVVTDRGKAFRFPIDLVFLSSRACTISLRSRPVDPRTRPTV